MHKMQLFFLPNYNSNGPIPVPNRTYSSLKDHELGLHFPHFSQALHLPNFHESSLVSSA